MKKMSNRHGEVNVAFENTEGELVSKIMIIWDKLIKLLNNETRDTMMSHDKLTTGTCLNFKGN